MKDSFFLLEYIYFLKRITIFSTGIAFPEVGDAAKQELELQCYHSADHN
jgi:hypothetical protein